MMGQATKAMAGAKPGTETVEKGAKGLEGTKTVKAPKEFKIKAPKQGTYEGLKAKTLTPGQTPKMQFPKSSGTQLQFPKPSGTQFPKPGVRPGVKPGVKLGGKPSFQTEGFGTKAAGFDPKVSSGVDKKGYQGAEAADWLEGGFDIETLKAMPKEDLYSTLAAMTSMFSPVLQGLTQQEDEYPQVDYSRLY